MQPGLVPVIRALPRLHKLSVTGDICKRWPQRIQLLCRQDEKRQMDSWVVLSIYIDFNTTLTLDPTFNLSWLCFYKIQSWLVLLTITSRSWMFYFQCKEEYLFFAICHGLMDFERQVGMGWNPLTTDPKCVKVVRTIVCLIRFGTTHGGNKEGSV